MADTTELLGSKGSAAPTPQRSNCGGYVSEGKPAPETFADKVWVIVPEYSTETPIGPCEWGQIHGSALPQPGARVLVSFDERNVPVITWWEGEYEL